MDKYSKVEGWTYGSSDTFWIGYYYETEEEAIEAGREYFGDDVEFVVGKAVQKSHGYYAPDGNNIIDIMVCHAFDNSGESAEDYLIEMLREDEKQLTEDLAEFLDKWLNEKGAVDSEWVLNGARIQGIDLGNAAYEKPEPSEGAIEFSYQTINVDGIEF